MIDPDNITIQRANLDNNININEVPEIDFECYNLEDEKDYKTYIKDIERLVRKSYEYRQFISYIRDNMNMNKCAFLKGVTNAESYDIKIEIHHYPFTLADICEIVYRKRNYFNESLSVRMVAKEVVELHYKLLIGLIPLSETVHELYHNGRLFIPIDKVLGRYNLFIDYYKPFCDPDQLEIIERIEKYTNEHSDLLDTTIIDQNRVTYDIQNENYAIPDFKQVNDEMVHQISAIKENNYLLPSIEDEENNKKQQKEIYCPIEFDPSLIKDKYK